MVHNRLGPPRWCSTCNFWDHIVSSSMKQFELERESEIFCNILCDYSIEAMEELQSNGDCQCCGFVFLLFFSFFLFVTRVSLHPIILLFCSFLAPPIILGSIWKSIISLNELMSAAFSRGLTNYDVMNLIQKYKHMMCACVIFWWITVFCFQTSYMPVLAQRRPDPFPNIYTQN